jgi:transposase
MNTIKKPPIWFPSLLQIANNLGTHSWFNINQLENPNRHNTSFPLKDIKTNFIKTKKFIIYPNNKQKNILQQWFHSVINMYNITNNYIKNTYSNNGQIDSFFTLRKLLEQDAKNIIASTQVSKHILDYSIKHCIEMYKSAISNKKKGYIKQFEIANLQHTRNRFNLVLEPNNFSKKINGFYVNALGEMKYDRKKLNHLIKKNSILQYNKNKDKYYLIVPFDKDFETSLSRDEKCGIDLGVRTFATLYSPNETLEIGTNLLPTIDLYHKRKDQLQSFLDKRFISQEKYNKLTFKYGNNMRNKIDDLHKKMSSMLVKKFETINIGKISTKSIVSNENSTTSIVTKRRLLTLSFYNFLDRLKITGTKYMCNINLISEYKTSMTCNNCCNENPNLGSNKIYDCVKCKMKMDRDINSAIIFYKGGYDKLM